MLHSHRCVSSLVVALFATLVLLTLSCRETSDGDGDGDADCTSTAWCCGEADGGVSCATLREGGAIQYQGEAGELGDAVERYAGRACHIYQRGLWAECRSVLGYECVAEDDCVLGLFCSTSGVCYDPGAADGDGDEDEP